MDEDWHIFCAPSSESVIGVLLCDAELVNTVPIVKLLKIEWLFDDPALDGVRLLDASGVCLLWSTSPGANLTSFVNAGVCATVLSILIECV